MFASKHGRALELAKYLQIVRRPAIVLITLFIITGQSFAESWPDPRTSGPRPAPGFPTVSRCGAFGDRACRGVPVSGACAFGDRVGRCISQLDGFISSSEDSLDESPAEIICECVPNNTCGTGSAATCKGQAFGSICQAEFLGVPQGGSGRCVPNNYNVCSCAGTPQGNSAPAPAPVPNPNPNPSCLFKALEVCQRACVATGKSAAVCMTETSKIVNENAGEIAVGCAAVGAFVATYWWVGLCAL